MALTPSAWAADAERYLRHVKALAAPEMKGRGAGSPELETAARYLADQFREAGLEPLNGRSWFQPFQVTTGAKLGPQNALEVTSGDRSEGLHAGVDYVPFSFSGRGGASGGVVFAGYGISAPEYEYDDYTHLDVKDKLVVVLRHEPQEFDDKSKFLGKNLTRHALFINKAINARNRGARALLVVNDQHAHVKEEDLLAKFGSTQGPEDAGLPVVQVKAVVVDRWLAPSGGSLKTLAEAIDGKLEPQSMAVASLQLRLNVDIERALTTVNNVAGLLRGASDEHLIIGAHYDHLGLGEQNSLAPAMAGQVHPGADDNASGAAGLIELARLFTAQRRSPGRSILFLAFAAEEIGLLGSSHYTARPLLPLDKAVAMINLDMIGRLRQSKVYVGGVGTGSTFKPLVEEAVKTTSFQVDYSAAGYDSSDHMSFAMRQVPVLFFFSGLHGDYHKPSDTWEKIDAPGTARLLDLVYEVAGRLDRAAERPQYVRVTDPGAGRASGSAGGYGPYFGSIPDFGQVETGVKFGDVRDGSPAAKAGLKAGDILIEFGGQPVKNLYDFTYALRSKKPGDQVEVKVLRDNQPLEVKVTLEQRR